MAAQGVPVAVRIAGVVVVQEEPGRPGSLQAVEDVALPVGGVVVVLVAELHRLEALDPLPPVHGHPHRVRGLQEDVGVRGRLARIHQLEEELARGGLPEGLQVWQAAEAIRRLVLRIDVHGATGLPGALPAALLLAKDQAPTLLRERGRLQVSPPLRYVQLSLFLLLSARGLLLLPLLRLLQLLLGHLLLILLAEDRVLLRPSGGHLFPPLLVCFFPLLSCGLCRLLLPPNRLGVIRCQIDGIVPVLLRLLARGVLRLRRLALVRGGSEGPGESFGQVPEERIRI
mmetsp:Transcript_57169/g.177434  ORF Transcript_57169/g.177434 Transcript_57169/m.177434 type:complete len:285 (-) Transcript_57169:278-1132(-)